MANNTNIVSPGVFTREYDQSFLAQGVSQIGAAIIGPTAKGPAFVPTLIESYEDYVKIFGAPDLKSYTAYTVKSYLRNAGRVTVVRVAGTSGYSASVIDIYAQASGSTFNEGASYGNALYGETQYSSTVSTRSLAILAPTTDAAPSTGWKITLVDSASMRFVISTGSGANAWGRTASFDSTAADYITDVFGSSPNAVSGSKLYVYANFDDQQSFYLNRMSNATPGSYKFQISGSSVTNGIKTGKYDVSYTPWIQAKSGLNLFQFATFNAGKSDIKVSIKNIRFPGEIPGTDWGLFDVQIRQLDDTDNRPVILEQYTNLTLDPTSVDYIAQRIGDSYLEFDNSGEDVETMVRGDYPNRSKYVRVIMNSDEEIPYSAIPYGYDNYILPIDGLTHISGLIKNVSAYDSASGTFDYKTYFGFDFSLESNHIVTTPTYYYPSTISYITSSNFNFDDTIIEYPLNSNTAVGWSNLYDASGSTTIPSKFRKFSVAFQGGNDGLNPLVTKNIGLDITKTNMMGFDVSTATSAGSIAYKNAIDTISNPDEYDINMLILPGVINKYAGSVIQHAIDVCEQRGDAFFLFDAANLDASVDDVISSIGGIDSNYSATYYPWVKIYDNENTRYLWVPPSVVMAGVIAFSDKVSAEWWAPAGLNRGGIDATAAYYRLTQEKRDKLYLNRVNPIATFVGQGISAWGQKTLQTKASALDRINVRRLLIALKKYISSATKYLVFEQNTVQTRTRFLNIVNPYMESVQQRQGLYAFRVVMDETTNTADVIDRNMMYGKIYIQPAKTAEMIVIDFNITPTGASFEQ